MHQNLEIQFKGNINLGAVIGLGCSYLIFHRVALFANASYSVSTIKNTNGKLIESNSSSDYYFDLYTGIIYKDIKNIEESEIPIKKIYYSGYNINIGIRYFLYNGIKYGAKIL